MSLFIMPAWSSSTGYWQNSREPLKNYLRCHFCVKSQLKMLIIMYKLRFLADRFALN